MSAVVRGAEAKLHRLLHHRHHHNNNHDNYNYNNYYNYNYDYDNRKSTVHDRDAGQRQGVT